MSVVYRCDVCEKIGSPGDTWIQINVRPYYIPANSPSPLYDECAPAPPHREAITCSPACAMTRIRQGMEDVRAYACGFLDELDEPLLDPATLKKARHAEKA